MQDFVKSMLTLDPKRRITESKALCHPWVNGKAAKSDDMPETLEKIKVFNANRRMKVGMSISRSVTDNDAFP